MQSSDLLTRLKGRPAFPFETIAVAISFSPRLEALLTEAKRIADTLHGSLLLIHVGEKTVEKETRLEKLMQKLNMDERKFRIQWMDGNPVDTILKLCKLNVVDLLIIGALRKENLLKYYVGSVARKISRKAKCSVLLLTNLEPDIRKAKRFVVNVEESQKSPHTINTALYLAKNFNVGEITMVKETHIPGLAMTMAEDSTAPEASKMKRELAGEEEEGLSSILDKCNTDDIKINEKFLKGKPGFAIRNYAQQKKADLLIVNSPDKQMRLLDRIFTHDLEYILEDLPCNVLIVHSRV
ncbi:MAG TPA: universal stress protein [Bacteroidia bacterium]|jgi:nucleotide-binding universal stress UspA family protein|nr:universal stress protein [Bacteroidia bacterium]